MNDDSLYMLHEYHMGGIILFDRNKDIDVKAVEAGVDVVMVCHEYEHETDVYNGLLQALQNGELSESRIDASTGGSFRSRGNRNEDYQI